MLQYVDIKNFILVSRHSLQLKSGLGIITGQTGAGKSMLFKAIAFAFGEKVSSDVIKPGEDFAQVTLTFDITHLEELRAYLKELSLEDDSTLIIRRHYQNKKSRLTINDTPISTKLAKSIETYLISWQKQHAHLKCHDISWQLTFIDGQIDPLIIKEYNQAYQTACEKKSQLESLQKSILDNIEKEILQNQLNELETLPTEEVDEINALYEAVKQIDSADQSIEQLNQLSTDCSALNEIISQIKTQSSRLPESQNQEILSICQSIAEDAGELDHLIHHSYQKMRSLNETHESIKAKISTINHLARQLHTFPEALPELKQNLQAKLDAHLNAVDDIEFVKSELTKITQAQQNAADQLSLARKTKATSISKEISIQLQQLGLTNGQFSIELKKGQLRSTGQDDIQFLASMNPELPLAPIKKSLSGGELTRLSLLLNLLIPKAGHTLLMDEVDTGVSGQVASKIGHILHELSTGTVGLCITHTPQVAASGDYHLYVQKTFDETTAIEIILLDHNRRIHAIAELIAGNNTDKSAIAHAKKLCEEMA